MLLCSFSLQWDAIKVKTQIRPAGVFLPQKIPSQEKAVKCYVFSGSILNGRTSTRHDAQAALRPSACDMSTGKQNICHFLSYQRHIRTKVDCGILCCFTFNRGPNLIMYVSVFPKPCTVRVFYPLNVVLILCIAESVLRSWNYAFR